MDVSRRYENIDKKAGNLAQHDASITFNLGYHRRSSRPMCQKKSPHRSHSVIHISTPNFSFNVDLRL